MPIRRTVTIDNPRPTKRARIASKPKGKYVSVPTRTAIQRAISAARETKECHVNLTEVLLSTIGGNAGAGAYIFTCPVPNPGTTVVGRIGNRINPISLNIKMMFHNNSGTLINARVVVMRVKQGNAITNTGVASGIFNSATGGQDLTIQGDLSDLIRTIDSSQNAVMYDQVIPLGYIAVGYASAQPKIAIRSIKLKPLTSMVFEDGEAVTDPALNRYVLMVIPRNANGDEDTGSSLEFTYFMEMKFKD